MRSVLRRSLLPVIPERLLRSPLAGSRNATMAKPFPAFAGMNSGRDPVKRHWGTKSPLSKSSQRFFTCYWLAWIPFVLPRMSHARQRDDDAEKAAPAHNKKGGQSIQLITTYTSHHTNNLAQERDAVTKNLWLLGFLLVCSGSLRSEPVACGDTLPARTRLAAGSPLGESQGAKKRLHRTTLSAFFAVSKPLAWSTPTAPVKLAS